MSFWHLATRIWLLLECLRLGDRFIDRADQVERLFRHAVVLAFRNFLEALDGFFDRHVLAFEARELRRDEERLRQEPLNLARARYRKLVFFGQFVDAKNRDDVLKV